MRDCLCNPRDGLGPSLELGCAKLHPDNQQGDNGADEDRCGRKNNVGQEWVRDHWNSVAGRADDQAKGRRALTAGRLASGRRAAAKCLVSDIVAL
tara:strand:- start:369 stop:653 length:285 start_codon:yes stop_codon:yes gene_type:complete